MDRIDLNCDLGESFGAWAMGDDAALLELVTSANVACGFHAGDPRVLLTTCRAAAARGVRIGAHVAYRDLAGFGRDFLDIAPERLYADVLYQLAALSGVARTVGTEVGYVKPHGALYNAIVHHRAQAEAVVGAVADFGRGLGRELGLLGLPGSVALDLAAAAGVRPVAEAFCDRAYAPDGTLVPRREPGALLHDAEAVAERMVRLVQTGRIAAVDGTPLSLSVDSVCVHGDSPGAVAMARRVRDALTEAGVALRPFS